MADATPMTDLPNGYYAVPVGKLVNAVTWLEMLSRPSVPVAEPVRLVPATAEDQAACRALYAAIGTPWLWSRAYEADAPPGDSHFACDDAGHRIGLVQFVGRNGPDAEIAFFGLEPQAIGKGLGGCVMAAALDLVWRSATRVWLHTCSFDHPAALRFYISCGFRPYATGFEIMDDPRLAGLLPNDAAPHVPLITPEA